MTKAANHIALLSSQDLAGSDDGTTAPEWVHLLPAGAAVSTGDARGPYHVASHQQIIDASFEFDDRLPIDETHATDLAAPRGEPAPARGWIVAMQARDDGIWGQVEWTPTGNELVATKAYRGLSPVIRHTPSKALTHILRASLVNRPNLKGLQALHQEQDDITMDWMKFLADLFGLGEDATEEQIKAALTAKMGAADDDKGMPALQSQLSEIGVALGAAADADVATILAAATAAPAEGATIVALQSEITGLATELNEIKSSTALNAANDFVDGAIKTGHVGVKPLRDHYIAMHQEDPARVEKEIGALPVLGATNTTILPPAAQDGTVSLNAEQTSIAKQLGLSKEEFVAQIKRDNEEAL